MRQPILASLLASLGGYRREGSAFSTTTNFSLIFFASPDSAFQNDFQDEPLSFSISQNELRVYVVKNSRLLGPQN